MLSHCQHTAALWHSRVMTHAPFGAQVRNKSSAEYVRRLGSRQFLNHLDNLTCIGRKNELYRNLRCVQSHTDALSRALFPVSAFVCWERVHRKGLSCSDGFAQLAGTQDPTVLAGADLSIMTIPSPICLHSPQLTCCGLHQGLLRP